MCVYSISAHAALPACDHRAPPAAAPAQKHAATVVREIVKHTPELAQLVVGNGGVASLVDYVAESSGNNRLPGIMALGYIAAFSETLALSVVAEKALPPLVQAINEETEDHLKSATAWTLGQIGRHTPDHAKVRQGEAGGAARTAVSVCERPVGSTGGVIHLLQWVPCGERAVPLGGVCFSSALSAVADALAPLLHACRLCPTRAC